MNNNLRLIEIYLLIQRKIQQLWIHKVKIVPSILRMLIAVVSNINSEYRSSGIFLMYFNRH